MAKEDKIAARGTVLESLPNGEYRVQIDSLAGQELGDNSMVVTGYISGHMRRARISILNRDSVDIEISPYDITRGRITYRHNVNSSV